MENIKVRIEDYGVYGLNKYRSFLNPGIVKLKTQDEFFSFCGELLILHGCFNSAIFGIGYDDCMYITKVIDILTDDDDDPRFEIEHLKIEAIDLDVFAVLDAEERFCCYGLLIEIRPGVWKLI